MHLPIRFSLRQWFAVLLLCLLTTEHWILNTASAAEAKRPPNFIVILADDLGAKELGCYGSQRHQTPHLDRMAAEGTRFATFFSTPLCTPTRVALMTGQYGFRTGYLGMNNKAFIPAPGSPETDIGRRFTFADLLKSRGYATAQAGKWQLSGRLPTLIRDAGFDEYRMWAYEHNLPAGVKHPGREPNNGQHSRYWHPSIVQNGEHLPTKPEDFGPDLFNDFVIDFARRHRERPFFIYYTSVLTHGPRVETPDPAKPGARRPAGLKSNLEYLDHLMGRLLASLKADGLAANTYVFFIGDNGTAGEGKGEPTELGARVPGIMWGADVKRGVVSPAVADLTDILPTLADLSGATLPKDRVFDGRSFAPVLRGQQPRHRDWIYTHLDDGRVLRDERWLLEIPFGNTGGKLFDCGPSRDGTGYRDVTNLNEPEAKAARERFAAVLAKMPEPKPRALTPEETKGKKK